MPNENDDTTTREDYRGRRIRICHKKAHITDAHPRSYTAEIELGGVSQHVALSESFVHERLGCQNHGCNKPARRRSSFCSTECGDEHRGQSVEELISPDGGA